MIPCRLTQCYHDMNFADVCALTGGPCFDGFNGIPCEDFLDKKSKPSPNHVFDISTKTWKLKENQKDNSN